MREQAGVISTLKHPAIIEARRSIGDVGNDKPTAFPVEGINLVSQAAGSAAHIDNIFFLASADSPEYRDLRVGASSAGIRCYTVTKGVFVKLLGLGYETSAQVLAIVRRKPVSSGDVLSGLRDDTLLAFGETIQDPRNVGVMIRNADATGVSCALFSSDSANVYSRQCVRSTTGSIFRVAVSVVDSGAEFLRQLKDRNVGIIGTSAHASVPFWEADYSRPCVIVFGNETTGLSEELKALCDVSVGIPVHGGASSFNVTVANGIVLCEAARRRS